MGSQRRIAQSLMDHFELTEEEAYSKVRWIEEVTSHQDEVTAAIWPLIHDGDVDEALSDLRSLCHRLSNSTMNLQAAFTGVKRRPKNDESAGPDSH